MKLKDLSSIEDIHYSWTDGGFHRTFLHEERKYEASLLPFAEAGSACSILRVADDDDPDNITASVDERRVYYKAFQTFKPENINTAIKDFIVNYAL